MDLSHFDFGGKDKRAELVILARAAEAAERYEDMCAFMKGIVKDLGGKDLSVEERNLLSVAYKNAVGTRRAAWRLLQQASESNDEINKIYTGIIEKELQAVSHEVLGLLENELATVAQDDEAKVFYKKMTGDYYRYLAEATAEADRGKYRDAAKRAYEEAFEVAKSNLSPTHPIRLGLALNYSVCLYEIVKDPVAACNMAKTAFDEAISKLDQLDESSYKDSTLIMQLLRDNLTLWTSENDADDD